MDTHVEADAEVNF